jgi:hypothetical protein
MGKRVQRSRGTPDEVFTPRFTAIDCIGAMWLAVTVERTLQVTGLACELRYAVDHGGTPSVAVYSAELGRVGLAIAKVDGIMAIAEKDQRGEYLRIHETPEHRALALKIGTSERQ